MSEFGVDNTTNNKKKIIIGIIIVLLIGGGLFTYLNFFNSGESDKSTKSNDTEGFYDEDYTDDEAEEKDNEDESEEEVTNQETSKTTDNEATAEKTSNENTSGTITASVSYGGNNSNSNSNKNTTTDTKAPSLLDKIYNPDGINENDNSKEWTNKDVTVTLTFDEKVTYISETGWKAKSGTNGKIWVKTYTTNTNVILTFEDLSGNKGTTTVSIDWIDKEAPVVTLNGLDTINYVIGVSDAYIEEGATVTDNVDSQVTNLDPDTSISDTPLFDTVGTYILKYKYTDSAGNISNIVERTIIVTEAP